MCAENIFDSRRYVHKVNGCSSVAIVVTFDLLYVVSYVFDAIDANKTLRRMSLKILQCKAYVNNNKNWFTMLIDALYIIYVKT